MSIRRPACACSPVTRPRCALPGLLRRRPVPGLRRRRPDRVPVDDDQPRSGAGQGRHAARRRRHRRTPRTKKCRSPGAPRGPLKEGRRGRRAGGGEQGPRAGRPAREFYTAFYDLSRTARRSCASARRERGRRWTCRSTVGQGTDERKPLMSLFVFARGRSRPRRHWIAWTMLGPYDASSRAAEDYLGWHFNPERSWTSRSISPAPTNTATTTRARHPQVPDPGRRTPPRR